MESERLDGLIRFALEASPREHRRFWVETLERIARPVLEALAEGRLSKTLPLAFHPERGRYAPLEAFGRLFCGIAPWLHSKKEDGAEEALRAELFERTLRGFSAAVEPASPDYMNFCEGSQPLVDTAFLCHGLLRAPGLAAVLDGRTRENLIKAVKITRAITPGNSNWLFFSAMTEAGLCLLGSDYDPAPIRIAVDRFMEWYKGDGFYGDGPWFHWDYYNSFVIHPMFVDLVSSPAEFSAPFADVRETVLARASRQASVLERLISPEGAYPIIGRSVVYRFGAFQLLAQASLEHFLDGGLSPAQVRCGLTAVSRRTLFSGGGIFDGQGWLVPGVIGKQPGLAEEYINVGSLYLCSTMLLPLGLAAADPFWAGESRPWTSRRIDAGEDLAADHAIVT